ncbi:hypothetical protein [uncultured Chryseobacterium sp.]|nr:hypothetical protein [uncultured Chryseobacterium sp.]
MRHLYYNSFFWSSMIFALLYYIFLLLFSLDTIDSGFILSFVGRLKAGQIIYKDFDYIRPFGSPLFWKTICYPISFKNPYLFIIVRALVILQTLIISYLVIRLLDLKINSAETITLTIVTNIFFLHSFNIMPWHTIDGIFFATFSIFFTHRKYYFSAIILAFFAALTKQSFYIYFIFSGLLNLILILKYKRNIRLFDIIISSILLLISFAIILQEEVIYSFQYFLKQTKTENGLKDFLEHSLYIYFPKNLQESILYASVIASLIYINICKNRILPLFFLIFSTIIFISPLFNQGNYKGDKILFISLAIQSIFFTKDKKIVLCLLLLLGWTSSISWGYNTPIFLIFFILMIFFYEKKYNNLINYILPASIFLFFSVRFIYPYFSESPLKIRFIRATNINAISGIYMSEKNYLYFKESYRLHKKYNKITFLPGNPVADIINNDFPGRASWEMDVEYPNWTADKSTNNCIIVDKNPAIEYRNGFFKSSITTYLLKNKTKIDSTKYFYIYK